MTRGLIVFLMLSAFLGASAPYAAADQVVILGCRPDMAVQAFVVIECGTSAGVPVACPVLDPSGITGPSCAQTLATFLSVPGFQLVVTQAPASSASVVYTIIKK